MKKVKKTVRRGSTKAAAPMLKSEFARACGVKPQTITSALKNGLVIAEQDGMIDPARRINADYQHDAAIRKAERVALSKRTGPKLTDQERRELYMQMPNLDVLAALENIQPTNLKEAKLWAETMRTALETRDRLAELMERGIITDRLSLMSENIDMFSALTNTVTAQICRRLKREDPDSVAQIKKIIAPEVEKIIKDFKNLCQKKL
ncbi:MAG TPA: hypothetical protein P5295_18995 [Spirochaetota bacterium]|nr:hypothetical protein [Spirochaetota bacterium]